MSAPEATSLRMFGRVIEPSIEWSDVESRLRSAETYWLVTVPARGVPAPRPVWGVWLEERLLLSVGSPSARSGVAANPSVAVHLGDAIDVVIVEGTARRATQPFDAYVAAYNEKYAWDFKVDDELFVVNGTIEVVPSVVFAWTGATAADSSADMTFPKAAGRWVLPT